jgi:hypothetical protein
MCSLWRCKKHEGKMKLIYSGIIMLFCISFISAVPQVVFTSINLTINNGTYKIIGEGINAQDNFGVNGNCTFNYERQNIPITFSREIGENSTDIAILIRALASNDNMSAKWQDCMNNLSRVSNNLSICSIDTGYKQNYSDCSYQLITTQSDRDKYQEQITTKNNEINELANLRNILIGACAVLGFLLWNTWNKKNKMMAESPVRGLPSNIKI